MKSSRTITALALAITMFFTACGVSDEEFDAILKDAGDGSVADALGGKLERGEDDILSHGRDAAIHFDDIQYVRPDPDALQQKMDEAVELAGKDAPVDDIVDILVECDADYFTCYTMYAYSELRYYHDMTDEKWAEEYAFCDDALMEMDILYDEMYVALAASPAGDDLEDAYYGDGFVEYYGEDYMGYSDETYAELSRRENEILAEYREIQADPTVRFRGEEVSYYELIADPDLTAAEYDAVEDAYYKKYSPVYGELYIELVQVRNELAVYCGYDTYEEYAYALIYERDYAPADVDVLLNEIQRDLAPLYRVLSDDGEWDRVQYTDMSETQLIRYLSGAAAAMGGDVEESWEFLHHYGMYDVTVSPNKVDMSFQTYLEDLEAPFAFVKTWGENEDLLSFAHEFGHCVDAYVNYNDTYSLELAEIYSQAMEYLTLCYLDGIMDADALENLTRIKMLDTLDTYVQQASFVDFERQIYSLPAEELTVKRIEEISLETAKDYGYFEEGHEDYYGRSWIDIVHFFEHPCYVISYCVSNDAAFQIYQAELAEPGAGLKLFEEILPREYDGFYETLEKQSDMADPLSAGRMKETAAIIEKYF